MALLTPGKLFLADQRGVLETATFRRCSTFQFGSYVHAHKQPVGRLLALNEETLAGGHIVSLPVTDRVHLLILPITGSVWASTGSDLATLVEVTQVHVLSAPVGSTVHFTNPYETELISFLHIWLLDAVGPAAAQTLAFDWDSRPNQLVAATPLLAESPAGPWLPAWPFQVQLGRFAGRTETGCTVLARTLFFAFVLAGAFELEGRLLQAGDGLALWDTPSVELEALSKEATILILLVAA